MEPAFSSKVWNPSFYVGNIIFYRELLITAQRTDAPGSPNPHRNTGKSTEAGESYAFHTFTESARNMRKRG